MKVKITYTPEQERQALTALAAVRRLFPSARVHESRKTDRVKVVYLTITSPQDPSRNR